MKRRTIAFLVTLVLLVAPLAADAQRLAKIPRIGWLSGASPAAAVNIEPFRQGLRELGWIEGQTMAIEYRWAEGEPDRLPTLAADLVRFKVDVIVALSMPEIRAAKEATMTIPIVMRSPDDPVGARLVASLARPGGNIFQQRSISTMPSSLERLSCSATC